MNLTSEQKLISAIVVGAVILFGGLTFALMKSPSSVVTPGGAVTFNDTNAPVKGKTDSSVVVRMYSDFQCPACKLAEPALRNTIAAFSDRVKFVWKDFPLMTIHPNARAAANAARCAEAQGKFWEYHDRLFDGQDGWPAERDPKDRFMQFARETGLNEGEFTACYNERRFDNKVMDDVKEGEANAVNSTPTFYINDRRAMVRSEAEWKSTLEQVLREMSVSSTTMTTSSTTTTVNP